MAFVQTDVNYASEYSRALAQAYPYLSYFSAIWASENSNRYKPGMGKTMYIPTVTTSGAVDVNRNQITGTFNRNWNNQWQAVELQMDREWNTLVDPMDITETGDVATIANITRTFNELQKIPEMDAFLAAKLGSFVTTPDTTTLTAANILEKWDGYLAGMTDARVNRDRVECYMTPAVYKLLKEAAGITRFVSTDEGFRGIDRNVARLDGVRITEVPSDIMKTAFVFDEGFVPAQTAKGINLIMVDPMSVAAPVKYETSMMSAPTAQSKGKYLYYERYYYGAFILNQRQAGVYAHLGAAPTIGTLTVTSVAGTEDNGDSAISISGKGIFADGEAAEGLAIYYTTGNNSATSCTYGAALPDGVTWVKADNGNFTLKSQTANKHITAALVNVQLGAVVASGDTTLVVKA